MLSSGLVAIERQRHTAIQVLGGDGWMDDLRLYVPVNRISVIPGRWLDDNKKFCAMKPRLRLKSFRLKGGSNQDCRSVG